MGKRTRLPRTPFLHKKFAASLQRFGADFLESQSHKHSGSKGGNREEFLADFFSTNLPKRYAVSGGEAIDLNGRTSGQLDLIFYDAMDDFPLTGGTSKVFASESLLATIEVKSKLTSSELKKSIAASRLLRSLRPYGKPVVGPDMAKVDGSHKRARYLYCLFVYDTDIGESNWLELEGRRFRDLSTDHSIDTLYVLNRGMVRDNGKIGRIEDENGAAITNFFFSILNFLQREASRRSPTPFERYSDPRKNSWIHLNG